MVLATKLNSTRTSLNEGRRLLSPVGEGTPTGANLGSQPNLARGSRGSEVMELQRQLNAAGANPPLEVDGKFGPLTDAAVRNFQTQSGIKIDGIYGPESRGAMAYAMGGGPLDGRRDNVSRVGETAPDGTVPLHRMNSTRNEIGRVGEAPPGNSGGNRTATFDSVTNAGARNQMVTGRITVNGNTYDFRSGGHGRGSLPPGEYNVTPHMWNRNSAGMTVGGEGYSFALSDKYDSRVGGTRSLLRIHPDGGSAGTQGCIGIVGDAATQRRFREDMRAELARNGGSFTLNVG